MKLIYYDVLRLKKKTENTKSILIVSPMACFQELFIFLLKAPLDPCPYCYIIISPSKTPYENVWAQGLH